MNLQTTKTVLFVAPSAYPLGGVQTWLDYLIPGLSDHNYRAVIALSSGKHHDTNAYLQVHPLERVELLESETGTIQGRVQTLENTISKVNPDVILVVNILDVYAAVNNLRRQQKTHARVISTLHGIHPGLISDIDQYHNVIDGVISTNRLTQRLINDKTQLDTERSYYAPYGVPDRPDRKEKRETNQGLTIAYVGRLEEDQKRIDDLLKIFTKVLDELPEATILIAGDGPDMDKFDRWYKLHNSPPNVKYLGVLAPQDLDREVYTRTDILLLTSHWETGPIVAWEAIRHGVTFVSSRYIGHQEEASLIHEHNCLMFDIGDVGGAIEQLKRASDSAIRTSLSTNAFELVESKYSIRGSIASWASCLDQVCNLSPKPYSTSAPKREDKSRLNEFMRMLIGSYSAPFSEALRRAFGLKFSHSSAGSEWPHCSDTGASSSAKLSKYVK